MAAVDMLPHIHRHERGVDLWGEYDDDDMFDNSPDGGYDTDDEVDEDDEDECEAGDDNVGRREDGGKGWV